MPQDPVPAETVSCSYSHAYGTLCLKWTSVMEVHHVMLQFQVSIGFVYKSLQRHVNTDAGITSAGTYIKHVPIGM